MGRALPDFVTVVSGVPRSGTSLLMQMLGAGGWPLLYDEERPADAHNPRGYFEFAPVRRLPAGAGWVAAARGRAVKVIHAQVAALPAGFDYRVILLRRDLREVVASQDAMLPAGAGETLPAARLAQIFAAQLRGLEAWLAAQPGFRLLRVEHAALLADPCAAAHAVSRFLGGGLDVAAMAAAVDPALRRQRAGAGA
jgi:hypothetical protein